MEFWTECDIHCGHDAVVGIENKRMNLTVARALLDRMRGFCTAWGVGTLDLLLPRSCALCSVETYGAGLVCSDCFARLRMIVAPCCDRCGVPLASAAFSGRTLQCVSCEQRPPAWDRARAAFVYDDTSRQLILPLKYADRTELAPALATIMVRAGTALLSEADLIVPVPVHWRRRVGRRYNQAALLARSVARLSGGMLMVDALHRSAATPKLAHLSAAERAKVMTDAIRVSPKARSALNGKRVLLIDDVLTTGATASACATVMRKSGATSVMVLAAARTEAPEREDTDRFWEENAAVRNDLSKDALKR